MLSLLHTRMRVLQKLLGILMTRRAERKLLGSNTKVQT